MKDSHRLGIARIPAWTYTNLKFLFIRTLASILRFLPARFSVVETVGGILGTAAMVLKIRRWKAVAAFARESGNETPVWRYVPNTYAQWARDRLWCELFYEAYPRARAHLIPDDSPLIREFVRSGKGGVLLTFHYGPFLYRPLLKEMGFDVRQMIGEGIKRNLEEQNRIALPFLRTARLRAFMRTRENYVAGKSEREVLRAVQNGAWMLMLIDQPREEPGGTAAKFFGRTFPFQDFPFKVAVRYGVPVLFCYFRKEPGSAYRLCIEPCGPIRTPGEGVNRYAAFMEARIRENPYLWIYLPDIMGWFRGR